MIAQYYHSMADEKETRTALEKDGMGHRIEHLLWELSGGEQQRVSLGIVNYPDLSLADESTEKLDKENESIVLNLFQ